MLTKTNKDENIIKVVIMVRKELGQVTMSIDKNSKSVRDIQVFDLIWNNTTDAIFTIGHDGAIINANPAFEDLFGWSVEDIKGLSFPPIFSHITKEEHQKILQQLPRRTRPSLCCIEKKT